MTAHRYETGAGGTPSRRNAALLAVAVASLLALCACNGDHEVRTTVQQSGGVVTETAGGEVERGAVSAATAPGRDSPLTDPTGSIGTGGSGHMRDGDPTDPLIRGTMAQLDRGELDIARLGQQKARDGAVRQYAARMAQVYERSLAQAGAPPAGPKGDLATMIVDWQTATLHRLTALPAGPGFDREFMARQMEAHETEVTTLQLLELATTNRALENQLRDRKRDAEHYREQAQAVQMLAARPPAGFTTPGMSAPAGGFYVPSTTAAGDTTRRQ